MLLAYASAVGAVVFVLCQTHLNSKHQTTRVRARISVLSVFIIGILVWPVLWVHIFEQERHKSAALVSLLWPIIILIGDIVGMHNMTYESAHGQSKRQILSIDSNALCSLTFALSGLIGVARHPCCNKIFLYAVLGCIIFILPASFGEEIIIETIQKVVLSYATGLLIGGILLVMTDSKTVGLIQG